MITEPANHLNSFEIPTRGTEPPLLDIRLRRTHSTVAVELIGDLDLSTVPELWEALAAFFVAEDEDLKVVAIDLSKLNYVDSTGLGCFAAAHKEYSAAGIRLYLLRPDPFVARLLQITGLDNLLGVD